MELLELPFRLASAAIARRQVVHLLRTRGVRPEVCEDAALVVSELAGNALRHGAPDGDGRLRLGWDLVDRSLLVEVTDGGGGRPVRRVGTPHGATTGRGLGIVAAVSTDWGSRCEPGRTSVWARLDTHPATADVTASGMPARVGDGLDPDEYEQTG